MLVSVHGDKQWMGMILRLYFYDLELDFDVDMATSILIFYRRCQLKPELGLRYVWLRSGGHQSVSNQFGTQLVSALEPSNYTPDDHMDVGHR